MAHKPQSAETAGATAPRQRATKPAHVAREPVTLPRVASLSSDIRTLVVNVAILIVLLIVAPVVIGQFWRNQVLIEPIAVPAALQRTGLTPEVAAAGLWDGLKEVEAEADSAKASVTAIPDSQQVDFSIPDAGLSIDSLIYYVREFFNAYETRISGELRCASAACLPGQVTLRLRIVDDGLEVIDLPPQGNLTEDQYFRQAAGRVMGALDPFTAIAADSAADPTHARAPDRAAYHLKRGRLLQALDRPQEALASYRRFLTLAPDDPRAGAVQAWIAEIEGRAGQPPPVPSSG